MRDKAMLDWSAIDTVLLDMDGTLLDLRFDNWFWQELIPQHYAAQRGLSIEATKTFLGTKFLAARGTLQWYCIEHWSRELQLDIAALKRTTLEKVGYLPGAEAFLGRLGALGKRRVLVTNAHPTTLRLKSEKVALQRHFDALYSTHAFAQPKENPLFWPQLQACEGFRPGRTLFIDDSLPVLAAARGFGIGYLRAVWRPDSGQPAQRSAEFAGVDAVAELM